MEQYTPGRLDFSTNWNNKLDCSCFSTIRVANTAIHHVGRKVEIYDNSTRPGKSKGNAIYLTVTPFQLSQLTESMARLDTGYSRAETIEILKRMYGNRNANVESMTFAYIIIQKIKEKSTQSSLF